MFHLYLLLLETQVEVQTTQGVVAVVTLALLVVIALLVVDMVLTVVSNTQAVLEVMALAVT
tara:strand:- start:224 stop:406 length:183 start_codon:yes stop_codon:yes gene_type:complete